MNIVESTPKLSPKKSQADPEERRKALSEWH